MSLEWEKQNMSDIDQVIKEITEEFGRNFVNRGDVGAALSIWMGDTEICGLQEGFLDLDRSTPWNEDTVAPLNSATNGPIATTVLLAIHQAGLTPHSDIGELWPELAGGSLSQRSLGMLLSHQCGLCALDSPPENSKHESIVACLEKQKPLWEPGESHGFHVGTFPVIADELTRRAVKQPIHNYWREEIANMLNLSLWIGDDIPEENHHNVSSLLKIRGPVDPRSQPAFSALSNNNSLTSRAYHLSNQITSDSHETEFPLPGISGYGSAKSLARFYSLIASGGQWVGFELIPHEVCQWAEELWIQGHDKVLNSTTAYSAGFMKDPVDSKNGTHLFHSSPRAFGFPGEGGTFAFGDPSSQLGFAYVANQMDRSLLPSEKALCLTRAYYSF